MLVDIPIPGGSSSARSLGTHEGDGGERCDDELEHVEMLGRCPVVNASPPTLYTWVEQRNMRGVERPPPDHGEQ